VRCSTLARISSRSCVSRMASSRLIRNRVASPERPRRGRGNHCGDIRIDAKAKFSSQLIALCRRARLSRAVRSLNLDFGQRLYRKVPPRALSCQPASFFTGSRWGLVPRRSGKSTAPFALARAEEWAASPLRLDRAQKSVDAIRTASRYPR
jgi:hypothetical protein